MRRVILVSLAAFMALTAPSLAGAEAIERASLRLVSAQQDTADVQATWTWKREGKTAAPNTAGVVALSLVRAWEKKGSKSAQAAALRWGDARIADLAAWRELYDPDAEALAELGRVSGKAAYSKAAGQVFDRRWAEATPEEALGRLLQVRKSTPSIVGYDVALVIRAAKAVGRVEFAAGLARKTLATPAVWKAEKEGKGWATTSRAAMLGALAGLSGKDLAAARARLASSLVKAQGADGSWATRNTQATAYSVSALASQKDAAEAVARGRTWLTRTQLKDGSWAAFHDGLPEPFVGDVMHEVTAEVLLALAAR